MSIVEIICIAIGLSMDFLAVTVAASASCKDLQWSRIIFIGFVFALFQALMPFIGWCLGCEFIDTIKQYSSVVSFAVLVFIGSKMIYEGIKVKNCECGANDKNRKLFNSNKWLFIIALSTNIDALGSGLIFVPYGQIIYLAMAILAVTAFVIAILGSWIGVNFSKSIKFNSEIIGGLILILIGCKILF